MSFDMFTVHLRTAPCRKVKIQLRQEDIDRGARGDAIECPVAHAVNAVLKQGHCIATTKQLLFYVKTFDRSDPDMVLGKGRICMTNLQDSFIELLKTYQSGGKLAPQEIIVEIPVVLLDAQ